MNTDVSLTIDEFAGLVSTSARNVRAYFERGLLHPPRMAGRTGLYDGSHIERVRTIHRLQAQGFSLTGIRVLFDEQQRGGSLERLVGATRADDTPGARSGATDATVLFPATKFRRPSPRSAHVTRVRSLEAIAAETRRHVLLAGGPGSGKSTLAAHLVDSADEPYSWVTLTPEDDEPGRFWAAVLIGLRNALPGFADPLLGALLGGGPVDRLVVDIAERLAQEGAEMTLVLDDLHVIADADVVRSLAWLLDALPPEGCRLLLCTRHDPPFPSARLVLRGQLAVLAGEDLDFDLAEIRELLNDRLELGVDAAAVDLLARTTEGWAAGVYLAALRLRAGVAPGALAWSLGGDDPQVLDYFAEEVFGALDPRTLEVLEAAAILDRFTAPLCDALTGRDDADEVLAELDRSNLFVVRLDADGGWHRLHQLFRGILLRRTATRDPLVARELHARAAVWHEEHGGVLEAIEHHLQAGGVQDAVRIVGASYPRFMSSNRHGTVLASWLARLPAEARSASATLTLVEAGVAGLRGEHDAFRAAVARLREFPADRLLPDGGTIGSSCDVFEACFHFGDLESGLAAARSAYRTTPPSSCWRPMAGASLALLASWVDGPTDEVLSVADEVLAFPGSEEQPIALAGAWALKGLVLAARGDPMAGPALARSAQLREAHGLDRLPQAVNTWTTSARARLALGDLDGAEAEARTALDVVGDLAPDRDAIGAVAPAHLVLAHVLARKRESTEAAEHLARARTRAVSRLAPLADEVAGLLA